jgi:hypothetical protein
MGLRLRREVARSHHPDMTDALLETLCRIPIEFHSRGGISMVGLVKESGYLARIEAFLRTSPEAMEAWFADSDNQPYRPAMYIIAPAEQMSRHMRGGTHWETWYVTTENETIRVEHADEFKATAHFVKHMIARLGEIALGLPRSESTPPEARPANGS